MQNSPPSPQNISPNSSPYFKSTNSQPTGIKRPFSNLTQTSLSNYRFSPLTPSSQVPSWITKSPPKEPLSEIGKGFKKPRLTTNPKLTQNQTAPTQEKQTISTSNKKEWDWYWNSDGKWIPYDRETSLVLEKKYFENPKQKFNVDSERFVDFSLMMQRRIDNPSKMRPVKREKTVNSPQIQTQTSTSTPANPFKKSQTLQDIDNSSSLSKKSETKNDSVITPRPTLYRSSTNIHTISQKPSSSQNKPSNTSTSIQPSIPTWLWRGDNGEWFPYDDKLCKEIEAAYTKLNENLNQNTKPPTILVDKDRFIDIENMLQRRFDNPEKKRYIKRTGPAPEPQRTTSEIELDWIFSEIDESDLLDLRSLQNHESKTQPIDDGEDTEEEEEDPLEEEKRKEKERERERNMKEKDRLSKEKERKKELRRQLYKCGSNFLTLKDIPSWEKYIRKNEIRHSSREVSDPSSDLNKIVSVWKGDITRLEIDAIVNAARPSLLGGGGIDGAIHRAAGRGLLQECAKIGGCEVGKAVITSGHRLPATHVIHTVGPVGEKQLYLRSCYQEIMRLVKENSIRSIALCCVSTGVYGYPKKEAGKVALSTIREWMETNNYTNKLERIIFCVYDDEDFELYERLMMRYFPPPKLTQV